MKFQKSEQCQKYILMATGLRACVFSHQMMMHTVMTIRASHNPQEHTGGDPMFQ